MSRIRTFIALPLPKAIRDRLIDLQERLAATGADVNWVEPENLHVTLLFLGEVDEREVTNVCRVAKDVCNAHESFAVTVETVGCFPNIRRPRVVWVGVGEGREEICAIHDALETPLMDLGVYRREARQFTPHITLGRVRGDRPGSVLQFHPRDRQEQEVERVKGERAGSVLLSALEKASDWRAGETRASEIHVLSSELTSRGPIYAVLSRAPLSSG
jgi:2'-5' RNA ligase